MHRWLCWRWRLLAQRPPLPAQQGATTTSSPGPAPHPSRHQQQAPEPLTAEAGRGSSSTRLWYMMKGQLSDSGPLPAAADAVVGRECCPPVTTHTLHATPHTAAHNVVSVRSPRGDTRGQLAVCALAGPTSLPSPPYLLVQPMRWAGPPSLAVQPWHSDTITGWQLLARMMHPPTHSFCRQGVVFM